MSFETALRAADPLALSVRDRFESWEARWSTIGLVEGRLLLLVAHAVREENEDGKDIEVIRIVSARKGRPVGEATL